MTTIILFSASQFLTALGTDGAIDEVTLSNQELDRAFTGLKSQVTDSIHRQESLLANVQVGKVSSLYCVALIISLL